MDMESPDLDHAFLLDGAYSRGLAGGNPGQPLMPMVQLSLRGFWAHSPGMHEALPVHMKIDDARQLIGVIQSGIDKAVQLVSELEEEDRKS